MSKLNGIGEAWIEKAELSKLRHAALWSTRSKVLFTLIAILVLMALAQSVAA